MTQANNKKLLIPNTFAKVGWDIFAGRDDVEATPYDPLITTPDFHALLPGFDGVALSHLKPIVRATKRLSMSSVMPLIFSEATIRPTS